MLFIIISSIIYAIVSCGYGKLLDQYLNKHQLLSIRFINGIFLIGILALIFAIFIPLNIYFEISLIVLGLILFAVQNCWEISFKFSIHFFLLFLTILFVGSMNAFLFDTYSYYLPTIKWLDQYGLVKGIANYDFNLGQHSLWHIIQAAFNDSIDWYYKINTFLIVVFLLYVWEIKRYILLIFLPVFFLFAASPSPDLVVFVLSIIMLSEWITHKEDSLKLNLIYSAFLILVKPIAFVLPVYFFYKSIKKWKSYKGIYAVVIILSVLFIFKNIYLTANFLFPLKFGNLSSFIHAIPESIYEISATDGRLVTLKHVDGLDLDWFKNLSLKDYYLFLLNHLHYTIILFLLFTLITFVFFMVQFFNQGKFKSLSVLLVIKVIIFSIITIQYRFLLDNVLLITVLLLWNSTLNFKIFSPFIILSGIFLVLFPNLNDNKINQMRLLQPYTVSQIVTPVKAKVETTTVNFKEISYHVILNYDFSLDVQPLNLNKMLIDRYIYQGFHAELIDNTSIKSGFKPILNTDSDIKELSEIYFLINTSRKSK